MPTILWIIVAILIVCWVLGISVIGLGTPLIHLILVIAVILILYNLFAGRRTV